VPPWRGLALDERTMNPPDINSRATRQDEGIELRLFRSACTQLLRVVEG
jgi:hypothetical protein